jgi:hypothetical protein
VAFDAVLRNSGNFDDCSRLTGFKEIPIFLRLYQLLVCFLAGLSEGFGRLRPIGPHGPNGQAGWILFTAPFLFAIWAVITFRRFTVVDPRGEVTTIVIIPEERYLESSFGEEYIHYKRRQALDVNADRKSEADFC